MWSYEVLCGPTYGVLWGPTYVVLWGLTYVGLWGPMGLDMEEVHCMLVDWDFF